MRAGYFSFRGSMMSAEEESLYEREGGDRVRRLVETRWIVTCVRPESSDPDPHGFQNAGHAQFAKSIAFVARNRFHAESEADCHLAGPQS